MVLKNIFKYFVKPLTRIRKLRRPLNNMKQLKMVIGTLTATSCIITLILYYRFQMTKPKPKHPTATIKYIRFTNLPMNHVPLNEIYPELSEKDDMSLEFDDDEKRAYMIDTPGCRIPASYIRFKINQKGKPKTCGKKAVFLKKYDVYNIRITIKPTLMRQYLVKTKNFSCCYQFLKKSHIGFENTKREYTTCREVQDGDIFKLEADFVRVRCYETGKRNVTHVIYTDVFAFITKSEISPPMTDSEKKLKYNVLMIGMDSMSMPRTVITMPRTANYFKNNFWLGFRGYNKVGINTFPNLIAALTGKNISRISSLCTNRMDKCNELLIWSMYKANGYVTAYGEDYLRLPDTFTRNYAFKNPPTDHYMRPFYLQGEYELYNGSLVCAGKAPSGQHLLDYALDFAYTYRNEPFFGMFWMNSFSHNVNTNSQDADRMFENFFNQLSYIGISENTFIIFFSDHGVRFGDYRIQTQSYYDERSPALFISIPEKFSAMYSELYKSAAGNQLRLLTPYDLHSTLMHILFLSIAISPNSTTKSAADPRPEGCTNCHSIFIDASENRTCKDVEIHQKWCSCHRLYPLDIHESEGIKSVIYSATHIKDIVQNIQTIKCWGCMKLSLKNIIRIHFYYAEIEDKKNLYYVVAFSMTPGNMTYEAVVLKKGTQMELVGDVSIISPYRGLGMCTFYHKDRIFCVCQKKENC